MVRGIRDDGVGRADQRADRASISLRGGIFLSADYGRVAATAGVSADFGDGVSSGDRRNVAYSGGVEESRYGRSSRLLLVLFCERTLPEISGEAVSTGLQQASGVAVLDAASGVAVPVESLSASGGDDCAGSVAGPAEQFRDSPEWRRAGRVCFADPDAVLDLGGSGIDLFCSVDQPGVLHVPRVFAASVVAGGRCGAVRADRV